MEVIPFKRVREFFEKYEYWRYGGCAALHFILVFILVLLFTEYLVQLIPFIYYFLFQFLTHLFLAYAKASYSLKDDDKESNNKPPKFMPKRIVNMLNHVKKSKPFRLSLIIFSNFGYNFFVLMHFSLFSLLYLFINLELPIFNAVKSAINKCFPTLSNNNDFCVLIPTYLYTISTYLYTIWLLLSSIVGRKLPCFGTEVHVVFLEKNKGLIFTYTAIIFILPIVLCKMNISKLPNIFHIMIIASMIITSIIYTFLPHIRKCIKGCIKEACKSIKETH